MNSDTGLIAPLVQSFFTDHLVRQRRASPQTVASYRDTFRLLIQHLSQTIGRKPSDLTLDDLQAKAIMRFLDGIERDRGNSVQTRNARLAAIRSFFRLVTLREPARLDLAAQVLAIPTKTRGPPLDRLSDTAGNGCHSRYAKHSEVDRQARLRPVVDAL
jgi:integrase/recombinase XerD